MSTTGFGKTKHHIKLIVYDFDGVFTNNTVILREDGVESVVVNRADGLAISMIKDIGVQQIILTTETSMVVEARANKLGIPVINGAKDKREALLAYCKKNEIALKDVIYVGNDINDLEAMKLVGYPVAPGDANDKVKAIAKIITKKKGGEGVVRELLDKIFNF